MIKIQMMFILTQLDPKYHLDIAEAQMAGLPTWEHPNIQLTTTQHTSVSDTRHF